MIKVLAMLSLAFTLNATAWSQEPPVPFCPKECEASVVITPFGTQSQGLMVTETSRTNGWGNTNCATCPGFECIAEIRIVMQPGPSSLTYLSHGSSCYQSLADKEQPLPTCSPLLVPSSPLTGTDLTFEPKANCSDSSGANIYITSGVPQMVTGGVSMVLECGC